MLLFLSDIIWEAQYLLVVTDKKAVNGFKCDKQQKYEGMVRKHVMLAWIQKNVVQTTDTEGKSVSVEILLTPPNLNLYTAVSCRLKLVITSFVTCFILPRTSVSTWTRLSLHGSSIQWRCYVWALLCKWNFHKTQLRKNIWM